MKPKPRRWACGVTTCSNRKDNLLPRTLASLKASGFDDPRLFVDGAMDGFDDLGLEVTYHYPRIRTAGNWMLGLAEIYIRNPQAEYFAMFQDDMVCCRNLKVYLESCPPEGHVYYNLYTFPCNHQLRPSNDFVGWHETNQNGLGAVALVFSTEAVYTLLQNTHFTMRPLDLHRGWRAIDGGVVESFRKVGWKEMVHSPSLVQHTGITSSMGNSKHPLADSFPGEDYDLMDLLELKQ
jgi:hypothetical protein